MTSVAAAGTNAARVKGPQLGGSGRLEGCLSPQAEVTVRMIAVQQAHHRALGHGRRMIAELPQALEPQFAHALDILIRQIRDHRHLGKQATAGRMNFVSVVSAKTHRIGSDIDVEVGAVARERIRHVERRAARAAFVEQIRRERGKPGSLRRIRRGAAAHQQRGADDRHVAVRNRADLESVGEHAGDESRESETVC